MTRSLAGLLLSVFTTVTLSGCLVHTRDHKHRNARHSHSCHPSQYWDGHKCKHKGKGHGARKHDGHKKHKHK
jgi:hypothetical protein